MLPAGTDQRVCVYMYICTHKLGLRWVGSIITAFRFFVFFSHKLSQSFYLFKDFVNVMVAQIKLYAQQFLPKTPHYYLLYPYRFNGDNVLGSCGASEEARDWAVLES